MTCEAPLSAIDMGFMSLTGTEILAEVLSTLLPHTSGVTLKRVSVVHGCATFLGRRPCHGLNILNGKTQEGLIVRLNMGDTLRLDSQTLPDTLFPC